MVEIKAIMFILGFVAGIVGTVWAILGEEKECDNHCPHCGAGTTTEAFEK